MEDKVHLLLSLICIKHKNICITKQNHDADISINEVDKYLYRFFKKIKCPSIGMRSGNWQHFSQSA